MKTRTNNGYTLVELLISIAIIMIISGAIYFSMNSSLESWSFAQDRMALLKVLSDTMDKIQGGDPGHYGLKDSLEIVSAGLHEAQYVPPWVDDTHVVEGSGVVYTLNRRMKAGTAPPICQARLPEIKEWQLVPLSLIKQEDTVLSQVRLQLPLQQGTPLRFTFYPDAEANPDTAKRVFLDQDKKQVVIEDSEGSEALSKNLFGVEITDMQIKYYNNSNELITDREWMETADALTVTGVEVTLEASLNGRKQTLSSFICLRNAPMRTGYITLKKDLRVRIPDSHKVRALTITNLAGISNDDELEVAAVPKSGKTWIVKAQFEKIGSGKPVVRMITVEYPPGTTVYTDTPKSDADLGINLITLDPAGLYDYDDDGNGNDVVMLEGDVEFQVVKMDIKGAGLFVRP